jgi:hypothetical protein
MFGGRRHRFQAVEFRGADRYEGFCAGYPVEHVFSHFLETPSVMFGRTRCADNIFHGHRAIIFRAFVDRKVRRSMLTR